MGSQGKFERIVAALHRAMLDEACVPAAMALIEEACGVVGHTLMVAEGPKDDVRVGFVGLYYGGERHPDMEREFLEQYHPIDERVPRMRRQPDGRLAHVTDQYTARELKTSRAYNEGLVPAQYGNNLLVRLDGPDRSHVGWCLADPVASDGWTSSRVAMVTRLVPHIRQFFLVRQALARAGAQGATVTALLDNARIGVVHLDRRGLILAANDRARGIFLAGDGLSDRDGVLRACTPDDEHRLQKLLAAALPSSGAVAIGGFMLVRRPSVSLPFAVYVRPVSAPEPDYGARHAAGLVLIAEAGRRHRVDPRVVAATLGLTPSESRVAAWLAEGKSVREMAETTGHTRGAVYWHLKQIYQKLHISRQADLVRLVLSIAEFG